MVHSRVTAACHIFRKHSLVLLHTWIPCKGEELSAVLWMWKCGVALYLLAHADLHDSVVDQSFSQVPVRLLFEAPHLFTGFINMFPTVHRSGSDRKSLGLSQ